MISLLVLACIVMGFFLIKLRQQLKKEKDFAAYVAHELRVPLTVMKGYAEILQDGPSSEALEKIIRNCHRMDKIINNLLKLADLEHVPIQTCDITALAQSCIQRILTVSPATHIAIEKSEQPILVKADPDLLELALMNLLENGIKYSNAPAHLTIDLKPSAGGVQMTVQDRGMGIPETHLPHIFERFYAVDKSRSRRLGGAGLGLSLVKTIIEKHKGKISVASTPGQGTTFTVVIPQQILEERDLGGSEKDIHQ